MNPKVMDAVGFISRFVNDHWERIADSSEVRDELSNQGFSSKEIADAFKWIEANTLGTDYASAPMEAPGKAPMRALTDSEREKLSSAAVGLLMQFYSKGIVDALILEEILERVAKSEQDELDEKEIKRITALTLFTRIQDEWLEILHSTNTLIH